MYLDFFGLSRSAFPTAPVSECFFGFTQTQLNLETLQDGLVRYAGPGILVGPSGTGKTMILSVLEDLNQNRHRTIRINASSCTNRNDLIQTILFELGHNYQLSNLNMTRLELYSNLKESSEYGNGILLLVDDAHHLDTGALEELEALSEIYRSSVPTVQMVLSGNSSLEEQLSHPSLDSFNQKIATRSYLHGVDLCQLGDYLSFQLDRAGGQDINLFSEDSVTAIHTATYGNIRLINQLCDFCLVQAAKSRIKRIDGEFVQTAWSHWQQIPSSSPESQSLSDCPQMGSDQSIIAFGSLDDNLNDPLASISSLDHSPADETPVQNEIEKIESEPVLTVDAAKQNAKATQEKVETLITFAFEQDIQKPVVNRKDVAASLETISSDLEMNETSSSTKETSINSWRDIPVGLMSAWSPSFDRSKALKSTQTTKNDQVAVASKETTDGQLESEVLKQLEQMTRRIVKPATDPPVVDCVAKANQSISHIDSMLHAIDSLDADWAEVERVLAESDLEIANQQNSPLDRFSSLQGDGGKDPLDERNKWVAPSERSSFSDAEVSSPQKVTPITSQNKEELFGSDELYSQQEVVLNDIDWTQFLKPLDLVSKVEDDAPSTPVTLSDMERLAENTGQEESAPEVEVVPIQSSQESDMIQPNFHPQSDDRRIITPSGADSDDEQRNDEGHQKVGPKLAKRKDLRALLTSLRGF